MGPRREGGAFVIAGAAVGLAGAIGAMTRGMAPTGSPVIDVVESALLGAVVSAGALWCPWWLLLSAATAGAAIAPTWTVAAVAVGGGLAALAAGVERGDSEEDRATLLRGVAGVALVVVFTRLGSPGFHGGPSLVAGLVFAVLSLVGFARRFRPGRVVLVTVVAVFGGLGASALLAVAGLGSRVDLTQARDLSQLALDEVRNGDFQAAKSTLIGATMAFRRADDQLRTWYCVPAAIVPVVGRHRAALLGLTGAGVQLSGDVGETLGTVELERLKPVAGRVDLAELRRITPSLDASASAINRLRKVLNDATGDRWIAAPLRNRLRPLATRAEKAASDAETARLAVRSGATMLGANAKRRYLVLFTTPSQARGLGGFAGNFAELTADRGQLAVSRFGRSVDLFPKKVPSGIVVKGPPGWAATWARFGGRIPPTNEMATDYWLQITQSPDLRDVGALVAEIYPQVGGSPIDGVIAVDPAGLSALLALTGPVTVPSLGRTLDSSSATEYLLRTQYRDFTTNSPRADALADVARATTEALLGPAAALPSPPDIAKNLSPAARANHLSMWSKQPAEQALLARIGADNALPPFSGDTLAVTFQNASASKLDAFVRRSVEYRADIDPSIGRVRGTVDVTVQNDATETGLPPYVYGSKPLTGETAFGETQLFVTVYTAYPVTAATVDGSAAPVWRWTVHGRNATTAFVRTKAGATGHVSFSLAGYLPPGNDYRLAIRAQTSGTMPDRYRVSVGASSGRELIVDDNIEGVRRYSKRLL